MKNKAKILTSLIAITILIGSATGFSSFAYFSTMKLFEAFGYGKYAQVIWSSISALSALIYQVGIQGKSILKAVPEKLSAFCGGLKSLCTHPLTTIKSWFTCKKSKKSGCEKTCGSIGWVGALINSVFSGLATFLGFNLALDNPLLKLALSVWAGSSTFIGDFFLGKDVGVKAFKEVGHHLSKACGSRDKEVSSTARLQATLAIAARDDGSYDAEAVLRYLSESEEWIPKKRARGVLRDLFPTPQSTAADLAAPALSEQTRLLSV